MRTFSLLERARGVLVGFLGDRVDDPVAEGERERVARQVWLLVCLRGGTCWVIGLMSCWEIEGIGVGKKFFFVFE